MESEKSKLDVLGALRTAEGVEKDTVITCPKHGKVTVKMLEFGHGIKPIVFGCPVCIKEKEEEELRRKEEYARSKLYKRYRESNVEPEYWRSMSEFIVNDDNRRAFEAVGDVISGKLKQLVISGGFGTGKTFLGSLAVMEMGGEIRTVYEISAMIRQSYSRDHGDTELDIVNRLARVPLLVIDEIGRSSITQAEHNWLSFIIDKRHTRKLPFILLSNTMLSRSMPKDSGMTLEQILGGDIVSRLRNGTVIIELKGADLRRKNS